jgi:integrase/recombinase XerD
MQEIKYVSPEQVEQFFKKIKSNRDKALFATLYYYGLRASEVGLLCIEDVDFENNRIFIRAVKNGTMGQHLLHGQVKKLIKSYLDEERLHKRTLEKTLFISQKGGSLSSIQIFRLFRTYARKAKFPEDKRHPHVFRHSIATHLAESGASLYDVQQHLRHKNVTNTSIYFALTNKSRIERQRHSFESPMLARI